MTTHRQEALVEVVKVAPPASVGTLTLCGVPVPDLVMYITLAYTIANFYVLIRDKFYAPWKEKRNGRKQ